LAPWWPSQENSITDITSDTWIIAEWMKSQLNWNNKIIEIQIIINIVRVSEHLLSKMLVLSGVFNSRILNATNYVNQDYMHVNYTLIVVYTLLLKYLMFLPGYGPIAITDWSIIVQFHLLVKHGL
jgi:uncharacterized membrane protein